MALKPEQPRPRTVGHTSHDSVTRVDKRVKRSLSAANARCERRVQPIARSRRSETARTDVEESRVCGEAGPAANNPAKGA